MYKGNPEIWKLAEGKRTGPKTLGGKIRSSIRTKKWNGAGLVINQNKEGGKKDSMVVKMMKAVERKYKDAGELLEEYNLFVSWLKMRSGDELNEIMKLENLTRLMETDLAQRALKKLEIGEPLDEEDIKQIRLLKELFVDLHKLKYGERHVNVNVGYKDIREMMFDEQKVGSDNNRGGDAEGKESKNTEDKKADGNTVEA